MVEALSYSRNVSGSIHYRIHKIFVGQAAELV
jgi:hypothetical protein